MLKEIRPAIVLLIWWVLPVYNMVLIALDDDAGRSHRPAQNVVRRRDLDDTRRIGLCLDQLFSIVDDRGHRRRD